MPASPMLSTWGLAFEHADGLGWPRLFTFGAPGQFGRGPMVMGPTACTARLFNC